jgi:plasmid stabilization system protein ParE
MAFEIEVSEHAEHDINEAASYIAKDSAARAKKWLIGLHSIFNSLQELPNRHSMIQEAEELGRSLRSIIHHSHRIVYEVQEAANVVYIVRVYHGAHHPLKEEDIS